MSARWTDCGDPECPECRDIIAARVEDEHRRVVERTLIGRQRGDWLGEAYGTGEERTAPAKRVAARASRAKARAEVRRVRRVLTPEQRSEALTLLMKRPIMKCYRDPSGARTEWLAEAWLELEHPTVAVASAEGKLSLARKVEKAVRRTEFRMKKRCKENKKIAYLQDLSLQ